MARDRPRAGFIRVFYRLYRAALRHQDNEVISPDLPWAQRVKAFLRAFPQREILIMVDAPTPELVEQAANRLQRALEADPELFLSVRQPQGGSFFATGCCNCRLQSSRKRRIG
jgi:hypothetical protein